MKYKYLIIVGALLILFFAYRKNISKTMTTIKSKLPRGLRNNNPGNIRLTKTLWQGETLGSDKSFKTFVSMEYGYRAIFVLLRSYISKGFDTIEKIINRYAPPTENVTSRYVKHVSERTGIPKNKRVSFSDSEAMINIVAAISKSENGVSADMNKVNAGFKLVGI